MFKGGGEVELKERVKSYGNITVAMTMQLHSSVTLTGFVKHKKEIFPQKLRSFADKGCRKKSVQE